MNFKSFIQNSIKKITAKLPILYTWLFSYLIICVFLFSCNAALLTSYAKEARQHAEKNYLGFLNSVALQFDAKLSLSDNLYTAISTNSAVNNIIDSSEPLSSSRTYPVSLTLSNQSKHTAFSQVYLYLPNRNAVISDTISDNSKNFFNCYYQNTELSFEQWSKSLRSAKYATPLITFDGQERYLDFMYRLQPQGGNSVDYAILVFRTNATLFRQLTYTDKNTGCTLILDQNNNVVMTNSLTIPKNLNYNDYNDKEILSSDNTVSLCITSSYTGWKFLHINTIDEFYSTAEQNKNLYLILLAISMLICCVLSVFFTMVNYHPLSQLITTYSRLIGLPSSKASEDYSLVSRALNDYVASKRNLYNLEKNMHTISTNEELYGLLQNAGKGVNLKNLEFPSDYFTVILFHPYNTANLFGAESGNDDTQEISFFIIQNIMEELFNNDGYFRLLKYNDCFAGIYCHKNQNNSYTYRTRISNNVAYGLSVIKENFQFGCDVGVSSVRTGPGGIFFARKEAQIALDSTTAGIDDIVFYDDFKNANIYADASTLQNLEESKKLLFSYIESGDELSATANLDKIYNLCTKSLDIEQAQMVLFQLIGDMLSVAGNKHASLITPSIWTIDPISSPTESWHTLRSIINSLCAFSNETAKQSQPAGTTADLIPSIVDYIQKNYSDCNLNTDFISNKFGFSARHISKLFKNEVGESFSNYITQYRIEKAKYMLKTTSIPIIQIYQQCGFVSEKTFFRSFAKYESVTPGKYRELNRI